MTENLWLVLGHKGLWRSDPDDRVVMVKLGSFSDHAEAYEAWSLVEERARRRATISERDYTETFHYACLRSVDDTDWGSRYPVVDPGRWSALLTRPGSRVTVTIYGNQYRGIAVEVKRLSATVSFYVPADRRRGITEPRIKSFPILPARHWDRGVQYASTRQ